MGFGATRVSWYDCGSHEGSNTKATRVPKRLLKQYCLNTVSMYVSMIFRKINRCQYYRQSSNSGTASKEKMVAFGRRADSKDVGFIGDLFSRQRKGSLRPTVRFVEGWFSVFSRESVANASHVRRPCKARRFGYVAMSPCHAARAVAARLKSIVRFGALAG